MEKDDIARWNDEAEEIKNLRLETIVECIRQLCPICAQADDIADDNGPIWEARPIQEPHGSWYHPVRAEAERPGRVPMICTAGKLWDMLEELDNG